MRHAPRPPYVGESYTHPAGQLHRAIRAVRLRILAAAMAAFVALVLHGLAVPSMWAAGITLLLLLWAMPGLFDLLPLLARTEEEAGADPQRGERRS